MNPVYPVRGPAAGAFPRVLCALALGWIGAAAQAQADGLRATDPPAPVRATGQTTGYSGDSPTPCAGTGPAVTLEAPSATGATGDLLVGDGAQFGALPVGSAGSMLVVDPSAPLGLRWLAPPAPTPFVLPATGQTECADSVSVPCPGTGKDGDLRKGVPLPKPRFTINGDGTVTDLLTDLTWLREADCFGTLGWTAAIANAASLASGSCGLTDGSVAGDWRLPNIRELASLTRYGPRPFGVPGISNTAGDGAMVTEGDPFHSDSPFGLYWSSTAFAATPSQKHCVEFGQTYAPICNNPSFPTARFLALRHTP